VAEYIEVFHDFYYTLAREIIKLYNPGMFKDGYIYLALGSNLGDRRTNLEGAIARLDASGVRFVESSPVYRTPALLLPGSPLEWDRPFFNCVIKVSSDLAPVDLLRLIKKIEAEMGRDFSLKWAPRPVDIDILFYKGLRVDTSELTIPHKAAFERYFLLDAMSFLCSAALGDLNYYGVEHQPALMGIINITPDSFSDGGKLNSPEKFVTEFMRLERELVPIIDIGAESTNPKASPITAEEEIERLGFVFDFLCVWKPGFLRPLLSIDTYHYDTAVAALDAGFDIINDANALRDERFIDLLLEYPSAKYVLTHSLSVPVKSDVIVESDAVDIVSKFLEEKLAIFERRGVNKERIFFDVGIGFGKTPYQSLDLMRRIGVFHKYGVKLLVGHSRKSFMKAFLENEATADADTIGVSLALSGKVDVLRVHTPIEHQNALLAYKEVK
jgi:2-amino-4-hydroxy-6-hydroxymethyldihydropteridine diphosphokinase/dihydropteroate synthase